MRCRSTSIYLLAAVCTWCASTSQAKDALMDSWYQPPAHAASSTALDLKQHVDFEVVKEVNLPEVEELLRSVPLVAIDHATASRLVGRPVVESKGKRAYLARSIRFQAHGAYAVALDASALRVHHSALGFDAPMVRQGIVVFLTAKPVEVFVSCSLAR